MSSSRGAENVARPVMHRTVSRMSDGTFKCEEVSDEDLSLWKRLVEVGDVFGYNPESWTQSKKKYRHECGCFATIGIVISMIFIMVLSSIEYGDNMKFVMESNLEDVSSVAIPQDFFLRVGVVCCQYGGSNANDEPCDASGYLDVTWQQRGIDDQDQATKTRTDLGTQDCAFSFASSGGVTRALCPASETLRLQGYFEAPAYRYLQADVTECRNSTAAGVVRHCRSQVDIDLFRKDATCAFVMEQELPDINLISNPGMADVDFREKKAYKSSRFYLVDDVQVRVEVFMALLEIGVESFIVHVESWIQTARYLMYAHHETVLASTPSWEDHKAITFYIGMDRNRRHAMITPFITMIKMVGSWGSYFTIIFSVTAAAVLLSNLYLYSQNVDELLETVGLKRLPHRKSKPTSGAGAGSAGAGAKVNPGTCRRQTSRAGAYADGGGGGG